MTMEPPSHGFRTELSSSKPQGLRFAILPSELSWVYNRKKNPIELGRSTINHDGSVAVCHDHGVPFTINKNPSHVSIYTIHTDPMGKPAPIVVNISFIAIFYHLESTTLQCIPEVILTLRLK